MAYTVSVTLGSACRKPIPIRGTGMGFITGIANLTEYHSTLAEVTDITKHFRDLEYVSGGKTDAGYDVRWNESDKAWEAWNSDLSSSVDGPQVETANGTDVGAFGFFAVGRYKF